MSDTPNAPAVEDFRGSVEVASGYLEISIAELEAWLAAHKAPWEDPHFDIASQAVERMKDASGLLLRLYSEHVEARRKFDSLTAEHARLREALVKVRAHTSHLPSADHALLAGLLQSIERITDAALTRTPQEDRT